MKPQYIGLLSILQQFNFTGNRGILRRKHKTNLFFHIQRYLGIQKKEIINIKILSKCPNLQKNDNWLLYASGWGILGRFHLIIIIILFCKIKSTFWFDAKYLQLRQIIFPQQRLLLCSLWCSMFILSKIF